MYWKLKEFVPGTAVMYVPPHVTDFLHEDVEKGVVSSTNDQFVFVKFYPALVYNDWNDITAKACKVENLYIIGDFDVSFVEEKKQNDLIQAILDFVNSNVYTHDFLLEDALKFTGIYLFNDIDKVIKNEDYKYAYSRHIVTIHDTLQLRRTGISYMEARNIIKGNIQSWKNRVNWAKKE